MEHILPANYLSSQVSVALVGCGGNGSQMLTGLARLNHALRSLGHPGLVVDAFDPDSVSHANVGRQLFSASDVGRNKAAVLVHRVNAFFGLDWKAQACPFEDADVLSFPHIVISCVDTRWARVRIDESARLHMDSRRYWLDLGNREVDGQVILGQWHGYAREPEPPRLPTVIDLFPEIADLKKREDNTPSCSLAEALERQELFVNQAVVTWALELLWALFRRGRISWHGAFVNLHSGRTQPLAVDPGTWRRMGYRASADDVTAWFRAGYSAKEDA